MERFKSITIIFLLVGGLLTSIALAKPAGVLLQEGIYAEEIEGNLNAAIKIYEQIIKDDSAERAHVAQALYRLGLCHLKKQNEQQAKAVFEKLVTQFPEQTSIVDKAQPLLDEMTTPDPAALMPPETLVYLEVGSPGKQLETILNMLKGTPFENPFAVIGGGAVEDAGKPRQKSPGDIMAALLNPSMMAEFKKIRGFAVGLAGVGNNPPGVAILFPGKSDALRGILLAGLSIAGTPGEPIEGMQTLRIGDAAGIAYDNNAIIIAQPMEKLRWCVKQYKGVTNEPTLASKNKAFKKLSRKVREESALTIWADVDKTFASLAKQFPNENMPQQFRAIDGIADLENIEDIIAHFSIQEKHIIVEANVSFKDGHKCLAYDLIRTPNLTRAGFKAVPSDAIALVSLALGESEDARIDTAQKIARNLTGLDIGREVFTNIEQVTLFAIPPSPASKESPLAKNISPILPSLGLVVTSHNPQRTHRLLTELLGLANLVTSSQMTDQKSNPAGGKYQIGVVENEAIYCYLGQADKSTILTLSPEVLQACLSAVKSRRTVLTAGPLHQSLSQLSPDISKLALVNIGGVVRVADAHIHREVDPADNPNNYPLPYSQLLEQLAKTCDNTIVQLRTGEELNNFNVRCSIDELPPLGGVFPVLMQLSRGIPSNLLPCATDPYPADGALVSPEAELELSWTPGINATSHKVYFGTEKEKISLLGKVEEPEFSKLPSLKRDNEYYWRVDEVQPDGSIVKGKVWSFNTGKLVAWWKLDETSGTTAYDSAGKYNGTVHGARWTRGQVGGALEFDGKDDYIDIDIPAPLEQMTIAMWLKYDTVQGESPMEPGSYSSLISRDDYMDTGSVHLNLINIDGSVFIDFNVNGMMEEFQSESSLTAGTWYHVMVTYDNPNKTATIYINGQVDISIDETAGPALIGEAAIGDWTGAFYETDRHLDGTLDDIRIYNYALSEDEVTAIYKSANPPLTLLKKAEKDE